MLLLYTHAFLFAVAELGAAPTSSNGGPPDLPKPSANSAVSSTSWPTQARGESQAGRSALPFAYLRALTFASRVIYSNDSFWRPKIAVPLCRKTPVTLPKQWNG